MGQFKSKHDTLLRAQPSGPSLRPLDRPQRIPSTTRKHVIVAFKLPPELLLPIFDSALEEIQSGTPRARFALNVSHVSRTWRAMAVGHTALWTTIVVDQEQSGLRKLVELFLARAGARLLDIVVHVEGPENAVAAGLALNTVFGASERWRSLTYRAAEVQYQLHRFVEKIKSLPLPQLQVLHFAGGWRTQSKLRWSVLSQEMGELPALRTLRLSAVRVRFDGAVQVNFDGPGLAPYSMLRNLTALEFDASTTSSTFNAPRLRDIIRETPRLTRLILGGFVPYLGTLVPSQPVLLPCLQLLQVPLPVTQATQIFQELSAPALEDLELRPVTREGWIGFTSFLAESGQTFPVLRALRLGNMHYATHSPAPAVYPYPGFLAAVPATTTFGFDEAGGPHRPAVSTHTGFYAATPAITMFSLDEVDDPAVLRGLIAASAPGRGGCWPQMQELRVGGTDGATQVHGHLVVALVKARVKVGCPLRTLNMQDTWVDAIDPEWLRQLPDTLDLQLYTRPEPETLGDADW